MQERPNGERPRQNQTPREKRRELSDFDEVSKSFNEAKAGIKEIQLKEVEDTAADRESVIFQYLIDHGLYDRLQKPEQLQLAVEYLVDYESSRQIVESDFDVTDSSYQSISERLSLVGISLETKEAKNAYDEFLIENAGKPSLDIMQMAQSDDRVPAAEKAKLADYLRLASPKLIKDPQDQKRVVSKINQVDLSNLPAPSTFITTEIYNDPDISEATKDSVAKEFGVERISITTGSELRNAIDTTITDPKTGEQRPQFDQDHPLEYREGIQAYVNERGERVLRTVLSDGRSREIQINMEWGETIGLYASRLALWRVLEEQGISNFFNEMYGIEVSPWQQHSPDAERQTRQVLNALLGGGSGYDGEIVSESDLRFIAWQTQFLAAKGDWAKGDHDIVTATTNLQEIGIKDHDGKLNIDNLRLAGLYMRSIWMAKSPRFVDVKRYIQSYQT